MRDILLVGCGNIGFRHLEALAALDGSAGGMTVVEPNAAHHPRIATLLGSLPGARRDRSRVLAALPGDGADFAVAIFATNSADRRAAYEAARERTVFDQAVFEKVLFPRLRDLDEVGAGLAAGGIAGHVNCPRRAAPGYRALRERLAGMGPVHIEVTGTAWGLASNAVHFLDLGEFLNGARLTALDRSGLRPGHVQSKRQGYAELFGALKGRLGNGAEIRLRCDPGDAARVAVTIRTATERLAIDEAAQTARALPDGAPSRFEMRHVSELTGAYAALLAGNGEGFCPYADSARQYGHMLAAVLAHLGHGAGSDIPCPIS